MYEVHGWVSLSESTVESDVGGLDSAVAELANLIASNSEPNIDMSLKVINGELYVVFAGLANRKRSTIVDDVLKHVQANLPGSWGLIYERDDETVEAPGPNAFRVTVLARGVVSERVDPFFSPCNPVIED
ncbi:Imm7 family immunity protein [Actinokineospora soli]|uniref:Imm7 family immunity protein n=1 Tax=Actinokineospora soli TaxID=1048753 RepID=A0ABW2TMB8_9PSEU